jgi:class 3 adenylate cyclase
MKVPDVSYARSGDVSIAYQVIGDGPSDLVFLPFLSNLYTLWQSPRFAATLRRLAEGRRLIVVNLRGVGLSDRPRGFTIESRMDDLRAVLDAEGSERPALVGLAEAAATCAVFAAANPDRVERLILYDPWARGVRDERERDEALAQIREGREQWGRRDALEEMARQLNPQWAEEEEYLEWFVWHHRLTASPATWAEFRRMQIDLDVTDVLPAIRVPTLVIAKERVREAAAEVAERIRGAELVIVPGVGRGIHENEFAAEAIEAFMEGSPQQLVPDTVLATVLFTDLVGSTERAAKIGDRAWRDLVSRHNEVVRRELTRFRGVEMDTAGDGFFARFDGPARAIRSGQAIVEGVRSLGLDVRVGVHAGECELHEEKVAGIAVSVGARVAALAEAGQVVVSSTVRDLVAGSGLDFVEHGTHELKGVPGEWRLFAVSAA